MKIFKQLGKFLSALVVASAAFIIALPQPVSADAEETPDYRIQMSPRTIDVELEAGKDEAGSFKVQNTGKKQFDFKIAISPYSVLDENYNPDYGKVTQYNDIVEWVTFSKTEGTVQPNESIEINYVIKVPKDVPAGGQYAMISAEMTNIENDPNSNFHVVNQIGIILYTNVKGVTRETGSIKDNKIAGILFNPPVSATSVVENTGNTHAIANYVLQVFPLFGDEEVYTNEENPATAVVLPETSRFNTVTWPNAPHLGIFRVKQTVTLFDQTNTTDKVVFICPIWLLFIVLLLIFFAIFWIFSRVKNRNK